MSAGAHAVPGEGPAGSIPRALLEEVAQAVLMVRVQAQAGAHSSTELGARRRGSGVLIDERGHILTNVLLAIDAQHIEVVTQHGHAAEASVVAEDHATGLALLRAQRPLGVEPMRRGSARSVDERDLVFAIAGTDRAQLVVASRVVEKRDYATGSEYWIDEAILTAPGIVHWNGAALVNRAGELVGLGRLLGFDRLGSDRASVRTVFVPVDLIEPVLPELMEHGARSAPPRPWLGVVLADAIDGVFVIRVLPGSPAERAGLEVGDVIMEVGTRPVRTYRELYRAIWSAGPAGTAMRVRVMRDERARTLRVESVGARSYYH